jgi:hypothetical protein
VRNGKESALPRHIAAPIQLLLTLRLFPQLANDFKTANRIPAADRPPDHQTNQATRHRCGTSKNSRQRGGSSFFGGTGDVSIANAIFCRKPATDENRHATMKYKNKRSTSNFQRSTLNSETFATLDVEFERWAFSAALCEG